MTASSPTNIPTSLQQQLPSSKQSQPSDTSQILKKRAIERARDTFALLPAGDSLFKDCMQSTDSLVHIIQSASQAHKSYKGKRSIKILQGFQKHTLWLQNMSSTIDVAVQTQAGIACPVWAPIKFVLQLANDHSRAAEQILKVIQKISEALPRMDLYEKLGEDPLLQVALLEIFTDVVEFSVRATHYFRRRTFGIIGFLFLGKFETEFGDILERIDEHARAADKVAVATELLKAAEFRAAVEIKQRKDLRIKCEKWLKPPNIREIHQLQNQMRLQDTCKWIWTHAKFLDWKSREPQSAGSAERLLCIHGIHGCGKSILASSIVESSQGQGLPTLMFFFANTDSTRQTIAQLTRSLLWQLIDTRTEDDKLDVLHDAMTKGQPTTSDLMKLIPALLPTDGPAIHFVVDGIDESTDDAEAVISHSLKLLAAHQRLKIILLGQPQAFQVITNISSSEPDLFLSAASLIEPSSALPLPIESVSKDSPPTLAAITTTVPKDSADMQSFALKTTVIEMEPTHIQHDIDNFIQSEIDKSKLLRLPQLNSRIFKKLHENSGGMFLWVKLMANELQKSSTVHEVSTRLQNIPRGLEKAYTLVLEKTFNRLDDTELRLALHVLTFLIVARRPLQVQEMAHLHALVIRSESIDRCSSLDSYLLVSPEENIQQVCGSLVHISNSQIQLIHPSLQRFLVQEMDPATDSKIAKIPFQNMLEASRTNKLPMQFHNVSLDKIHSLMGLACFGYMTLDDYGYPMQQPETLPFLRSRYPLLRYASCNALYHLISAETAPSLTTRVTDIVNSPYFISWIEHAAITWCEEGYDFDILLSFLVMLSDETLGLVKSRLENELVIQERTVAQPLERTIYLRLMIDIISGPGLFLPSGECTTNEIETESMVELETDRRSVDEPNPLNMGDQIQSEFQNGIQDNSQSSSVMLRTTKSSSRVIPSEDSTNALNRAIRSIATSSFQPRDQILTILGITKHMQLMRRLTDPLRLLFRVIIQSAASFPVYVLLGVTLFYEECGKYEEALQVCEIILPRIPEENAIQANMTHIFMGVCHHSLRNHELAVTHLNHALDRGETYFAYQARWWLRKAHKKLYSANETLNMFQQLMERDIKRYGEKDKKTIETQSILAFSLNDVGRHREALTLFNQTASIRMKLGSPMFYGQSVYTFCNDLYSFQKYQEANQLLRNLIEMEETYHGKNGSTLDILQLIGQCAYCMRDFKEATVCFTKNLKLIEKSRIEDKKKKKKLAQCNNWLGVSLVACDSRVEALPYLQAGFDGYKHVYGLHHKTTLNAVDSLIYSQYLLGHYEIVLRQMDELVLAAGCTFQSGHPVTINFRNYIVWSREALNSRGKD